MSTNFIAQLNAILHPLQPYMHGGRRAEASQALTNSVMLSLPSLRDGQGGWMLEPQVTPARRMWKVTLVEDPDRAGLKGFSGANPLNLLFTAREVLTLVREHVRAYLQLRKVVPEWHGYVNERIDPTTNLLRPEHLLDAA